MKDYVVIVNLASEAIALGADSEQEAKDKALLIIAEQYGDSVANDATYELEGEGNELHARAD
jgi:hypothetical protein